MAGAENDDRRTLELAQAGYTSPRGAAIFCAGLAVLGGALGSVFVAIVLNVLLGPEIQEWNMTTGAALGAVVFAVLGYSKVLEGNREALEAVEEAEWRREMRNQLGRIKK